MTLAEFARLFDAEGRHPAGDVEIASFEALIGRALPASYRAFLKLTAGGYCNGGSFAKPGETREYYSWMAALTDDPRFSLAARWRKPDWHPMSQHLLIIGSDMGGNPIAISLRDDRLGEVFVMDHELFSFDDERQETIEEAEDYGLAMLYTLSFAKLLAFSASEP